MSQTVSLPEGNLGNHPKNEESEGVLGARATRVLYSLVHVRNALVKVIAR